MGRAAATADARPWRAFKAASQGTRRTWSRPVAPRRIGPHQQRQSSAAAGRGGARGTARVESGLSHATGGCPVRVWPRRPGGCLWGVVWPPSAAAGRPIHSPHPRCECQTHSSPSSPSIHPPLAASHPYRSPPPGQRGRPHVKGRGAKEQVAPEGGRGVTGVRGVRGERGERGGPAEERDRRGSGETHPQRAAGAWPPPRTTGTVRAPPPPGVWATERGRTGISAAAAATPTASRLAAAAATRTAKPPPRLIIPGGARPHRGGGSGGSGGGGGPARPRAR